MKPVRSIEKITITVQNLKTIRTILEVQNWWNALEVNSNWSILEFGDELILGDVSLHISRRIH